MNLGVKKIIKNSVHFPKVQLVDIFYTVVQKDATFRMMGLGGGTNLFSL